MNEPIDLLQSHFSLARAEATLAFHLVAGETLRSAAVKLSISYETARTCLKSIFDKTGTCRQAELVIVILTALPGCVAPHWGVVAGGLQIVKLKINPPNGVYVLT